MPIYEVTQDSTGLTLELEGDRPPTQADVEAAFKAYGATTQPQPQPQQPTQQFAPGDPRADVLREQPSWWERIGRQEVRAPAGSRLEQEGVLGFFTASPEKREAARQAFEAAGSVVGPKTAAVAGVLGETAADIAASPGGILTMGIGAGLKGLAAIPNTLRAAGEVATASDLLAAAKTANTAQTLERAAVVGFAAPTVESTIASTKAASEVLKSDAPVEEKLRAATQAGVSAAFTGLLGLGARETFRRDGGIIAPAERVEPTAAREAVPGEAPAVAAAEIAPEQVAAEARPAVEAVPPAEVARTAEALPEQRVTPVEEIAPAEIPPQEPVVAEEAAPRAMAMETAPEPTTAGPTPTVAAEGAVPPVIGEAPAITPPTGMEPRRVAERIVENSEIPIEIRQAVADSPEASYAKQDVKEAVNAASKATEDQLVADLANAESNTRVVSGVDLFNRMIGDGRLDQATNLAISLAKSGTTWGQLINQFKLLKSSTPDGFAILVTKAAAETGRKLSPELIERLKTEMSGLNETKAGVDVIENTIRGAVEADAPRATLDALYKQRAERMAEFESANVTLNEALAKANPALATDLAISTFQGAVMAPLSIVRNIVGNTINNPAREISDVFAAAIDSVVSGRKNNTYDLNARTIARAKAFVDALPQATKVLLKGSDAMPYEVGKDTGNPLNFQRGWKNLFDSLTADPDKRSVRRILRDGYEATFGMYPDIMLRLAQATDVPFKAAQRASVITELGRKAGLTEKQIELAQKNIDLVKITDEQAKAGKKGLTPEQIETIEFEAARSVYQQDNAATIAVGNINRWIKNQTGPGGYIPYRLLTLFQKTPINILGEVISFTPIAGAIRMAKPMTARERNILLGKQIVGLTAITAFNQLYDKGLLAPSLDTPQDTEKARQLSLSSGAQPPGSLNLTGLNRYVKGGDPTFKAGDEVIDLNNLGLAGALGQMVGTARRVKEQGRADENDLMATAWGGVVGQLNFIMNQSLLKGTSDFIGLLNSDPRNSFQNFAKGLLVTAGSPFAPNILSSIDRANREFMPVIKDDTFIKSAVNEFNRRLNVLGIQIPGAPEADKLPLKRNLWGEGVPQTPPGENPWVYNLLDPIRMRSIPADPLNADIYRLWRKTGNQSAIPSIPSPKIEYAGVEYDKMTPQQYDRFAQLVGFFRRTHAEKLYMSGGFAKADSDRKIDLLNDAYSYGLQQGKHTFMQELKAKGDSLKPLAPRRGFQPTE